VALSPWITISNLQRELKLPLKVRNLFILIINNKKINSMDKKYFHGLFCDLGLKKYHFQI
jgi:hypothetical protein